jgi:DNA mismatch repair protein MutS
VAGHTPMIEQYLEIKSQNQDTILMFRLGDFYEMFFEDAKVASKELEIVLTARDGGSTKVPMCGVPYHAVNNYISRLINKGHSHHLLYRCWECPHLYSSRIHSGG